MFKTDDIVAYGINGVCKITGIEEKELLGVKRDYYVLKPVTDDKSTCFFPVDSNNIAVKIRKLLTKDEINQILDSSCDEKVQWINNERERKECYKRIVGNANHKELIKLIKVITAGKKIREKRGRNVLRQTKSFLKRLKRFYVMNFNMC